MDESQTTDSVLLMRPARFAGNTQTAASNRLQQIGDIKSAPDGIHLRALAEFAALGNALERAGIRVHVFDDTLQPHKPDAIFPNNWVSFHREGTAVLYPMMAPNRRFERRSDVVDALGARYGFNIGRIVDLAHWEREGKFLEGTGSLVLDRVNHIAYACRSPRTDMDALNEFARHLRYDVVAFEASDLEGVAVYHTNVLMSIGTRFAAVCSEAIAQEDRENVLGRLRASGREIMHISRSQMSSFAGNILELRSPDGNPVLVMSGAAMDSLLPLQRERLDDLRLQVISVDIPTIERLGGGSVRCMIAELHLDRSDCTR